MKKQNLIIKNNFSDKLALIKENLTILLIIPTLIGSLWQIIAICFINISYLRFFSITQALSDSLIIIFFCSFYFLMYSVISFYGQISNDLHSVKRLKRENIGAFIFALLIILTTLIIIILNNKLTIQSFFLLAISLLTLQFVIKKTIKRNKFKYIKFIKKHPFLTLSVYTIILGGLIILSIYINIIFHKTYSKPENFKNIEYLDCYLNIKRDQYKLLYFNDNYIFVELNENKNVEVIKFEELFNKDNCK